jgi:lipoate-protein ligase A
LREEDFTTKAAKSTKYMAKLLVIPYAVAPAAENMARDWLMLENFAGLEEPRLRTYGWNGTSWTFGYSQAWAAAEGEMRRQSGDEMDGKAELIRRATGGGLVDHRADWTYALVLPAAHPLTEARAAESYRVVQAALAEALKEARVPVKMAGEPPAAAAGLSVCFRRPERNDLVRADDGRKISGAAQKRNKRGMLLQGSVSRAAAGEVEDWERVGEKFAESLGAALEANAERWKGAAWTAEALKAETVRFGSEEWNRQR